MCSSHTFCSTVAAGAFSVGPISGGVFNPAVALGISSIGRFYNLCNMNDIWIYIVRGTKVSHRNTTSVL